MAADGSPNRFCIIDGAGGDLVIRLQASSALRAGADFALLVADGQTVRDRWKMAAGDSGSADHPLTGPAIPVSSLDRNALKWQVKVCALLGDSGAVEIVVLQTGVSCPMTKPAHWDLSNVPNCDTGDAVPITASLTFRFK